MGGPGGSVSMLGALLGSDTTAAGIWGFDWGGLGASHCWPWQVDSFPQDGSSTSGSKEVRAEFVTPKAMCQHQAGHQGLRTPS